MALIPALLEPPADSMKPQEVRIWFESIATSLLREFVLQVKGNPYQLAEIEFYYSHPHHQW